MRVALSILLAGCRIGFQPASDGGLSGDGADQSVDAPRLCANWGPFGGLVHVPELSSNGGDARITLSTDNRTAVFASNRLPSAGVYDLYMATRADPALPFDAPTSLANLNSSSSDLGAALTADGTELYFGSARSGTLQIYVATRANDALPFGAPIAVPGVINSVGSVTEPDVSTDGLTMYFQRASSAEIWIATRSSRTVGWETAARLDVVTSTSSETEPSSSSDGLELYFESDRSGNQSVMVATRNRTADPFSAPVDVPVLATSLSESGPEISADGTTLWCSITSGPSSLGYTDFYYVTRSCLD